MEDSDVLEDTEREEFRKQISELTFEQLIELKQKVGAKVFNETVEGKSNRKNKVNFQRTHKKRPREMSSKIPVDTFRKVVPLSLKDVRTSRDPRFDKACGNFDEKTFNKKYSFVKDMRDNEKQKLYDELNSEADGERKTQIKLLIQKIENREREEKRRSEKETTNDTERVARKQAVKDGKKAFFYKKSEKKLIDLVDNYESLKKSGKLMKHIERKIKLKNAKDRKKNSFRKNL